MRRQRFGPFFGALVDNGECNPTYTGQERGKGDDVYRRLVAIGSRMFDDLHYQRDYDKHVDDGVPVGLNPRKFDQNRADI